MKYILIILGSILCLLIGLNLFLYAAFAITWWEPFTNDIEGSNRATLFVLLHIVVASAGLGTLMHGITFD